MLRTAGSRIAAMLGALALAGFAMPANASLIGTTVDITSLYGSCFDVTVGGGVECSISDDIPGFGNDINIDIEESRIVFDFLDFDDSGGDFIWLAIPRVFDVVIDGLTWVDDPSAAIADITVTTELFGVPDVLGDPNTIDAVVSGANQITLNFGDLDLLDCPTVLCARLTVDITPDHNLLPEPASLALFGFGLVGLGAALRRKPALA